MSFATEKGRALALEALRKRREKNKNIQRVDNSSLNAGSPMYFYCITCNGEIVVSEGYITHPKLCGECNALKDAGWLE